jgi:flagellar hook-associated protein FlgK
MSDMLGISSGAIGAYQRALTTVSNNIANVNTEGYSRQDVVLKDSAPKQMASMYVGTGVILQTIKRQFDAFAESNLRNSTSDLSSQKPMVDYAKRVMDIMGDKSIGLSSAFDDFFASASALSADPASTVQRTTFLRSADGVASRFGELNTQLDLISTETRQGLESASTQVNTITSQLALINQGLSKSPTLEGQPPELLDRRDLALRQLSDLVRVKVAFSTNGSVKVSLGATMTQGVVVDGIKARPIGVDTSVKEKVELILDPYGKTESLASASGGQIGGYQSFISQVLEPAQKNLSALAQTFAKEANTIQKNGIDGYGQMGQDLFAFDPNASSPAAGIRMTMNDGMRVSTAAQFRVSEGTSNITTTRATVKYAGETATTALSNAALVNNPNKTAGVTFKVDGAKVYAPVTTLSAGVGATFYLDNAEPGQQLQVMTRDGRQLLGQALTETEKYQLFTPQNGFATNANYSDAYLNQSGDKAYRGLDMFYGAKANVLYGQNFDQYGNQGNPLPLPATLESARIDRADFTIPKGAIQVNGVALGEFKGNVSTQITFAGVKLDKDPGATVFQFQAVVGGKLIQKEVVANDSLASLQESLTTALGGAGLKAKLINDGKDILITDLSGREMSGVSLTPANPDGGASVGTVTVSSAASQVAQWINGDSQAIVASPSFGMEGFSQLRATIGGASFDVDLSKFAMGPLSKLASELQRAMREQDQSTNISVNVDSDQLKITDAAGRTIKNVALQPKKANDAVAGTVTILNSNVSKNQVRAEVFSELRLPIAQLDFGKPLILNDQTIPLCKTADELVSAINASPAGLIASIGQDGQLVIANPQGTEIRVGDTPDGNVLNVKSGTYSAQLRMVQVVRDMRVGSAEIDFKKPLQINGVNLADASYDLPATNISSTYTVEFGFPPASVSGESAQALAEKLNKNADFSSTYVAKVDVVSGRLAITSLSGEIPEQDLKNSFIVKKNGADVAAQPAVTNLQDFVTRINDKSRESGVVASLDENGDLLLSTTDPKGTHAILIGPRKSTDGSYITNALGLEPADFDVNKRLAALLVDKPYMNDIRVSFGAYQEGEPPVEKFGDPSDLAKLGFRTGAYIEGGSPDDLLLFVTGKGSANVAVGFEGKPVNMRDSLRTQSLTVQFTAADRYTIVDAKTGTQLADRHYDPSVLEPVIDYEGLQIKLSHAPTVGDSYTIDGNYDGLGNNMNMLDMVDLNKKPVTNGKTIANTYIDQINNVGNLAQQAIITQEALTVVNDQAVAARDKVSGVNLDDEAAALIRYQQAYQACAKAMQVSGELFDTIAQIR